MAGLSAFLFFSASAQSKKTTTKKEPAKQSEVAKTPAPQQGDLELLIKIPSSELDLILNSSSHGFLPWLKTTATPMNAEKQASDVFVGVLNRIIVQRNTQLKADSVKRATAKPDSAKTSPVLPNKN